MKIKVKHVPCNYAVSVKRPKHKRLKKPKFFSTSLVRILSVPELLKTHFLYLGCIPTQKYVTDLVLITNIMYFLTKMNSFKNQYRKLSC